MKLLSLHLNFQSFNTGVSSGCRMKSDCIEDDEESIPRLPRSLTSENTLVMSLCSKLKVSLNTAWYSFGKLWYRLGWARSVTDKSACSIPWFLRQIHPSLVTSKHRDADSLRLHSRTSQINVQHHSGKASVGAPWMC